MFNHRPPAYRFSAAYVFGTRHGKLRIGVCLRVMRRLTPYLFLLLLGGCFDFSAPSALPNGAVSEGNGAACASGHNSDGVCCDRACDDVCFSCLRSQTGQASGTCAPVLVGLDPREGCDGTCNGAGACGGSPGAACTSDLECGSATCRDGICCDQACDGVCVACSNTLTGLPNGVCGFVGIGLRREGGCADGAACDGAGQCYETPLGDLCARDFECSSGHCADGICCSASCDGVCESCTYGQCEPIQAGADPEDECPGEALCNGSGSCDTITADTPCADDDDCQGGYCCDHVCHSDWASVPVALNASEQIRSVHILDIHVPIIGTSMGRVLRYNGLNWESLGSVDGGDITRIDGNSPNHFVAFDGADKQFHRWVLGAWSVLDVPGTGVTSYGLFVDGDSSFYVFQDSNVWRWTGTYSPLTQVTPQGSVWRSMWMRAGKVYVGGGELVVASRTGWCGTNGRVVEVSGSQLVDTGWTLKCPASSSDGRHGPIAAFYSFPGIRGDGASPGSPPAVESFTLSDSGVVSVVDDELVSSIAASGEGPHIFRSRGSDVLWNTNGMWRSKTLDAGVLRVVAGARCEAYAVTPTNVYRF